MIATDTNALRTWGLVASAAAFATALTIAALGGCGQTSVTTEPVGPPAADYADPTMAPPENGDPIAEPAADGGPPPASAARPSFVIRFANPHPLARAQDIAARGRVAEARRAAIATLNGQRDLRGLCFDRFTLGGAETVLAACEDVADASAFEARWSDRLKRMAGVEYAEANVVAQPETRARP